MPFEIDSPTLNAIWTSITRWTFTTPISLPCIFEARLFIFLYNYYLDSVLEPISMSGRGKALLSVISSQCYLLALGGGGCGAWATYLPLSSLFLNYVLYCWEIYAAFFIYAVGGLLPFCARSIEPHQASRYRFCVYFSWPVAHLQVRKRSDNMAREDSELH